jgi:hypothetical protein
MAKVPGVFPLLFPASYLRGPATFSLSAAREASHTLTVWSALALARRLPLGLKATLETSLVCPWRVGVSWPVAPSHVQGAVKPDGTLELNRPVPFSPGPVEDTVRAIGQPREDTWTVLERI